MKNKLLLIAVLLMTSMITKAQENSSEELKLVSDNVEIPVGKQYRMYIEQYSTKIYNNLSTNPRIAVDFETADETIVEAYQYFKGLKEGTTQVTMNIYPAIDSWGTPDWNNLLDSKTFTVTVKNQVAVSIPTINTSWGISRDEIKAKIVNDYGYELSTDTYFRMNPVAAADGSAQYFEMYNTGIFEFPLIYNVFNDEDQMIAYQFVISNYERAWNTQDIADAPIIRILENNGYVLYGKDESGRPALYNPNTFTLVTFDNFILDGQFFMFCTFEYEENNPLDPSAIVTAFGENPTVSVNTIGQSIEVDATGHDGEIVEFYNAAGQLLGTSKINSGKASFENNQNGMVIVKVGKLMPMKVKI